MAQQMSDDSLRRNPAMPQGVLMSEPLRPFILACGTSQIITSERTHPRFKKLLREHCIHDFRCLSRFSLGMRTTSQLHWDVTVFVDCHAALNELSQSSHWSMAEIGIERTS